MFPFDMYLNIYIRLLLIILTVIVCLLINNLHSYFNLQDNYRAATSETTT